MQLSAPREVVSFQLLVASSTHNAITFTPSPCCSMWRLMGPPGLSGDVSGLTGYVSGVIGHVCGLCGDVSGLSGDVSGLSGDVTGLRGEVSGLTGDVDDAHLTEEERAAGVAVEFLVRREGAGNGCS
jgi:hypothetical protein